MSHPFPEPDGFSLATWGRQQKNVLIFLGVVMLLVWFVMPMAQHPRGNTQLKWNDPAIAEVLRRPEQVEAFTFAEAPEDWGGDYTPRPGYIGFHKIVAERGMVSAAAGGIIARDLLDLGNFQDAATEGCLKPGEALRFTRGEQVVEVLISFDCGTILLVHFQGHKEIPAGDMVLSNQGRNVLRQAFAAIFSKDLR